MTRRGTCFNEAAANGRGNHEEVPFGIRGRHLASMRPRRMAAEIFGRGALGRL